MNLVKSISEQGAKHFRHASEETLEVTAPIADALPGIAEGFTSRRDPEISKRGDWQGERRRVLQQICAGIQRKVDNGATLHKAIHQAARRWENKSYRSAPSKKMALSAESISRWFYFWRANGRTPAAFDLKYVPGTDRKLQPEFGALLAGLALETDALSFAGVMRAIAQGGLLPEPVSASTFLRNVPRGTKRVLRGVFRRRHELRQAERQARAVLTKAVAR